MRLQQRKQRFVVTKIRPFNGRENLVLSASAERPIIKFVFASRVKKVLNEKKAKSDRENNLIYHQKLPEV